MLFISITKAKRELEQLLESVSNGDRVVITKFGRPVVEIIEIEKDLYELSKFSSEHGACILNS